MMVGRGFKYIIESSVLGIITNVILTDEDEDDEEDEVEELVGEPLDDDDGKLTLSFNPLELLIKAFLNVLPRR